MSNSQNDQVREEDFHVNLTSYHYQVDLLLLFLWRGYKNGYDFQLETESKDAEKFDDLVFSYRHNEKKFVNYLQAKYSKVESNRWNYQDFATDRNIAIGNLKKYFTSFRKIKQKFSHECAENFILCSNIFFDSLKLKNSQEDDFLEFVETTSNMELIGNGRNIVKDIFHGFATNDRWRIYKLAKISSEIHEKLLKTTNLSILAEELANCIINSRKTNDTNMVELNMENFCFSKYHKALENENIIEKDQEVVKFSSWFTTGKKIKADEIVLLDNADIKFDLLDFRRMFKEKYEKRTSLPMNIIVFNSEVSQHFKDNLKSKSKKLQIESEDFLRNLAASLVKQALEEKHEMDEIFIKNFDIVKKVLIKTKRAAFTKNFINGGNLGEKANEFRYLLLYNLEKNAVKILESEVFVITERFYTKFQNEQSSENISAANCAEKIAECLMFKTALTQEIISSQNIMYLKNIFDCVDKNHARLKGNFVKNQNLTNDAESLRKKLFDNYLQKMMHFKEIVFKFNVNEMDNVVKCVADAFKNNKKIISVDDIGEETKNLITSLNGFVFEKAADESSAIKFLNCFLLNNDLLEDLKLLKAKLKKKLNMSDFTPLKEFELKMLDFHICSSSFDTNENIDEEIDDFCKKFIIVTSPSEKEIVECVKTELETKYDLQVPNYATELMQKTLDFAKGNEGQYITYQKTVQFFDDIVTQTNVHEMALITSQYCNQLKTYNIIFKEDSLENLMEYISFITNQIENPVKKQILHLITKSPVLTAMKINQLLQKNSTFPNNYIFSTMLLLLKSRISVLSALKSKYIQMAVVVDDNAASDKPFIDEIFSIIREEKQKQIIFITFEDSNLGNYLVKCCKVENDSIFVNPVCKLFETKNDRILFGHLANSSQNNLLKKTIKFNGRDLALNELIPDRSFYETLDGSTIFHIITEENIKILDTSPLYAEKKVECYIERYINFIGFNEEFLVEEEKFKNHFFAIEGDEKNDVLQFLIEKNVKHKKILTSSQWFVQAEISSCFIIIIHPDRAHQVFQVICRRLDIWSIFYGCDYFAHWLKFDDGKFFLVKLHNKEFLDGMSRNAIRKANLTKNILKIKENDFLKCTFGKQVTIVCDSAGMGKSTLMKNWIKKNKDQNIWPVRIELNEYTKCLSEPKSFFIPGKFDFIGFNVSNKNYAELILRTFDKTYTIDGYKKTFADFLQDCVTPESKLTFENYIFLYFFFCGKVLIIFDAFDEIYPTYSKLVLDIVNKIYKKTKNQIWITSRPNCQDYLETEFETCALNLQPFSEAEQLEYLTNVWKQQWNGDLMEEGIKKYALSLIHHFQTFVGKEFNNYMGIPLKMKMMAEIFRQYEEFDYEKAQLQKTRARHKIWVGCFDYLKMLKNGTIDVVDSIFSSHQNMNLFELYDIFTQKTFVRFLNEKVNADYTKNYEMKLKNIFYDYQQNIHKVLGLLQLTHEHRNDLVTEMKYLINKKTNDDVNKWIKDFKNGIENLGLVEKIINKRPTFEHLTYAEYFCASFLMEQLVNVPENKEYVFRVLNILLENELLVFQYCIKHLMKNQIGFAKLETILDGHSVIKFAIIHGLRNCAKFFISDEEFNDTFPLEDKYGKTLLHHAVEHKQLTISLYILFPNWASLHFENSKSYSASLLEFIDMVDNKGKKAIDYVSQNSDIFILLSDIRKLVEIYAKLCTWENSVICVINGERYVSQQTENVIRNIQVDSVDGFLKLIPQIVHIPIFKNVAEEKNLTTEEKLQIFYILSFSILNQNLLKDTLNENENTFANLKTKCISLYKEMETKILQNQVKE